MVGEGEVVDERIEGRLELEIMGFGVLEVVGVVMLEDLREVDVTFKELLDRGREEETEGILTELVEFRQVVASEKRRLSWCPLDEMDWTYCQAGQ